MKPLSLRHAFAVLLATAAMALAAGCGGDGSADLASPSPSPSPSPTPSPTPSPSPGDSSIVARRVMDEDSPAVTMTAALPEGASAELYLPPYAVRAPAEVTIATLPAALTLPTGTVAGGVRLAPDGLALGSASVLTLRVKGTLDPATTRGFAIHGDTVTYHPVKLRHEEVAGVAMTRVELPLLGFSDHGIVSNADPAVIAQAISASTPPLDALASRLALSTDVVDATELLSLFFERHVRPALETAATLPEHPVNLETAMRLYLTWREHLFVMDALFPGVNNAGVDPDAANLLLEQAILRGVDHWNGRCSSSLEPADARRAVTAWLWAPSVFLDRNAPLRKTDLLDKLCLKMEILGADLDALLESDQARPLVIRTGLQVLTQPQRHDVPVRVRAQRVLGGSVTGGPALTDAQGQATLTAAVQGDNPALAAELNASVVGFADVLDRTVRVYRPRNGAQPQLITGKKFTGVIKYYFDHTPPECRQGQEPGLRYLGDATADLFIDGDPFAYVVTLKETGPVGGGPVPPDWFGTRWEFHGQGDFGNFGGNVFSIETASGVQRVTDPFGYLISAWSLSFGVTRDDVQRLQGRSRNSCQYRELEMLPALPTG